MRVLNGYGVMLEVPAFLAGVLLSIKFIADTPTFILNLMDVFGDAEDMPTLFTLSMSLHWQAIVLVCIAVFIPVLALVIVEWGLRHIPFFTTQFEPTQSSNEGAK